MPTGLRDGPGRNSTDPVIFEDDEMAEKHWKDGVESEEEDKPSKSGESSDVDGQLSSTPTVSPSI